MENKVSLIGTSKMSTEERNKKIKEYNQQLYLSKKETMKKKYESGRNQRIKLKAKSIIANKELFDEILCLMQTCEFAF